MSSSDITHLVLLHNFLSARSSGSRVARRLGLPWGAHREDRWKLRPSGVRHAQTHTRTHAHVCAEARKGVCCFLRHKGFSSCCPSPRCRSRPVRTVCTWCAYGVREPLREQTNMATSDNTVAGIFLLSPHASAGACASAEIKLKVETMTTRKTQPSISCDHRGHHMSQERTATIEHRNAIAFSRNRTAGRGRTIVTEPGCGWKEPARPLEVQRGFSRTFRTRTECAQCGLDPFLGTICLIPSS